MLSRLVALLFSFLILINIDAQVITGKVTDITGKPLSGANIIWQNTNIGTSTNEAGEFSISDLSEGERTLLISFVGFSPEKIKVGKLKHWTI
ncbi:MAG TPA: carboxypeptidase-like regulatory domain-containing protein, partial [Saprospiraceae bacterium]|nr:carboxypeptidase-like regulatory domain-containing protein [Saprospiraceae bacterium]